MIDKHKEIMNLTDTIEGEINRMCVTKEIAELDSMHLHATKNIEKLWKMNYERLTEKERRTQE